MNDDLKERPYRALIDENIGATLRKVDEGQPLTAEETTTIVEWLAQLTDVTDQALRDMGDLVMKLYFTRFLVFLSTAGMCWMVSRNVMEYWK